MFRRYFCLAWALYFAVAGLSYGFSLYKVLPAIGFIGYGGSIILLLMALNQAAKKHHFLLVGGALILVGAVAALDMVASKQEMARSWMQWGVGLTQENVDGYIQVLIVLLNIFTGSLAASCLFHGLTRIPNNAAEKLE